MKILVVEDEPNAVQMLGMLLRMQGHQVFEALTGHAALALAASEQPDLAVVDMGLPDMHGLDIVRALHAPAIGWHCVCVALTNCDEPAIRAEAFAAGVDYFLLKSEDVSRMLSIIDGLARQNAA